MTLLVVVKFMSGHGKRRNGFVLRCDSCFDAFGKTSVSVARMKTDGALHFCSPVCRAVANRRGGPLYQKIVAAIQKQHGSNVKWTWDIPGVCEKRMKTWVENYGVDHPFKSNIVKEAISNTCRRRFGVDAAVLIPHVKIAAASKETRLKAHETMKRAGKLNHSRPEDAMYQWLCHCYGFEDVERWVIVNGWEIDCYVKSTATCYQLDGVHFHGLDGVALEKLRTSHPERYIAIMRTKHGDAAQYQWFKKAGLSLIRLSEFAFTKGGSFVMDRSNVVRILNPEQSFVVAMRRANSSQYPCSSFKPLNSI